jgi:hypothetical protein
MPYLYKEQRKNPIFNVKNFLLNLFKGIIHALINYFLTIYIVYKEFDIDGHDSNLWLISVILFTNILMIVTINIIIFTKYHTIINWIVVIVTTLLLYILYLVIVEKINIFDSSGTMNYTFNSALVWFTIILVSGICGLIDFAILTYNQLFVKSIYHQIRSLPKKDDISFSYIQTLPIELQNLLLQDDKVKEFNKENNYNNNNLINIKNEKVESDKKLKNNINIISINNNNNDNTANVKQINNNNNDNVDDILNNNKNIEIYPKSQTILNLSPKSKKKKKIVKKKKKKQENLIDNKIDSPTEPAQEPTPNSKVITNKKKKHNNENNENGDININEIKLGEGREGEVIKIKNSAKPFGNIKFNNRNVKNNNRNEISKGQFSMRDQTDRGLLKSNL